MNKITKEQWLAALESGEFKQARGCLWDTDGTCCLGVAAKLCGAIPGDSNYRMRLNDTALLSIDAGLLVEGMTHTEASEAITLNDGLDYDFPQIAAEFRTRWGMEKATVEEQG